MPEVKKDKETVIQKAEKALVSDYYKMTSHPKGTVSYHSAVSQKDLKELVMSDEELRATISIIVDTLTKSGYTLVGSKTNIQNTEKLLSKLRFSKILRKIYWNILVYGNAFIEIVKTSAGTVVKLKVVDTPSIEIDIDEKGNVFGYYQVDPTTGAKKPYWSADEMVHISVDEITSSIWGNSPLTSLDTIITLKKYVLEHIEWLFKTNQFRTHFHAIGLSKNDVKSFISMIKEGMIDREKFLITVGNAPMEGKVLQDTKTIADLLDLLQYLRHQILTLLRVPPIIAGTVDNSNRSNSEVQARIVFATRINAIQQQLNDEITEELFPAMGIKNVKFVHKPIDIKEEKDNVDIAIKLIGTGADKEKVLDWLNKKGLDLPEGLFPKEATTEKIKLPENSNLYPSRQPQDKGIEEYGINENFEV